MWFYAFFKRWPGLKVPKPHSLEMQRAKFTSDLTIKNYFLELGSILKKCNIEDKPERIYNVDETSPSAD